MTYGIKVSTYGGQCLRLERLLRDRHPSAESAPGLTVSSSSVPGEPARSSSRAPCSPASSSGRPGSSTTISRFISSSCQGRESSTDQRRSESTRAAWAHQRTPSMARPAGESDGRDKRSTAVDHHQRGSASRTTAQKAMSERVRMPPSASRMSRCGCRSSGTAI